MILPHLPQQSKSTIGPTPAYNTETEETRRDFRPPRLRATGMMDSPSSGGWERERGVHFFHASAVRPLNYSRGTVGHSERTVDKTQ